MVVRRRISQIYQSLLITSGYLGKQNAKQIILFIYVFITYKELWRVLIILNVQKEEYLVSLFEKLHKSFFSPQKTDKGFLASMYVTVFNKMESICVCLLYFCATFLLIGKIPSQNGLHNWNDAVTLRKGTLSNSDPFKAVVCDNWPFFPFMNIYIFLFGKYTWNLPK